MKFLGIHCSKYDLSYRYVKPKYTSLANLAFYTHFTTMTLDDLSRYIKAHTEAKLSTLLLLPAINGQTDMGFVRP